MLESVPIEHVPLLRERSSNPIARGELSRLVSDGDIEAIRALQKTATPTALKSELFSRDFHQRTPLALALQSGDKQLISLLLSLGIIYRFQILHHYISALRT